MRDRDSIAPPGDWWGQSHGPHGPHGQGQAEHHPYCRPASTHFHGNLPWCSFKEIIPFLPSLFPSPSSPHCHLFPRLLSPPSPLLISAPLISQPLCRCLSPLSALLISSPPHSSSVYIGKTLVQVKHVFLITTFPLIAGKKILWSSRFCALGIDNRKPFYPSPVSHSPRACEALGEFGRGPKKRAMPVSHSLPPAPRGHPGHVEVTNHCIPLGTPACSCRVLHTQETPPSAALLGAGADPGWAPAAC